MYWIIDNIETYLAVACMRPPSRCIVFLMLVKLTSICPGGTYIHTCIHAFTHAYIHTCMHTCIHAYINT